MQKMNYSKLIVLLYVAMAVIFSGCKKDDETPIIEVLFSASKTNVGIGEPISYTDNTVADSFNWKWTFEGSDSATSSVQNPSNISYSEEGTYDVTLTIISNEGFATVIKTDYITVSDQIQPLLNAGTTPAELIAIGYSVSDLYGKTYQGGLIFYFNGSSGLVVAPSDQSKSAEWGCYGSSIPGAYGSSIGTGSENTTDITDYCSSSGIAAKICSDLTLGGYSDWFLPSRYEANEIADNIGSSGNFNSNYYWTSTQGSSSYAYYVNLSTGSYNNNYKYNTLYVRAIRAF